MRAFLAVSSQGSSSIRISCPQCGGAIKVPPFQIGQRIRCPRCDAEIAAAGQAQPEPPEAVDRPANASAPASDTETLPPAPRPDPSPHDDVYGISCLVCGTRLHVRPPQAGTTIRCPDCYSPVVVKGPPKRNQSGRAEQRTWEETESPVGPTAKQADAQSRLKKVRIEQEEEEAEEREHSAERFTEGLFEFFPDPHAVVRLAILAVCFELAMTMFHWGSGMTISEDESAVRGEATSLVAVFAMVLFLLAFLIATAACGLALVKDTSHGLRKIEHWPGVNVLTWGRDVFYIVNAGILAALPGVALGILLGLAGVTGMVLFAGAATFGALFPPTLLSMFRSNSALALISNEVWAGIRERPDPWKLTYLITTCAIISALFAFILCLGNGFLVGRVSAVAMVAFIMIYFRRGGRLFCILAGRDVKPAASPK